jgi:lysophospholipase L1-like esterase
MTMHTKTLIRIMLLSAVFQVARAADSTGFSFTDEQLKNRYLEDFRKWDAQDRAEGVDENTVLCIGSSSMRGWHSIHRDLAPLKVIHRGFGGSSMVQVLLWKDFFLRYPSDTVLIYEGDNDMANPNVSPELFVERCRQFCGDLIRSNPDVKIYLLSVKPSIARWNLWPRMQASNELLQKYAADEKHVEYIDTATPMLGEDGLPIKELFLNDNLHMTPAGYRIWTECVRRALLNE